MKHIKMIDENFGTVLMVQVENEIGMLKNAREYNPAANELIISEIPDDLKNLLSGDKQILSPELLEMWKTSGYKTSGNWYEVFGDTIYTDEIFMAWYYAKYTDYVASCGKQQYSLPMFVNAALNRPGYLPGQYPSAGPLPHLVNIWKTAAPSVDFLSPDIYFSNFSFWCSKYDLNGNPLFIPEVYNQQSLANAFFAIAEHNSMGYSPFSIESLYDVQFESVKSAYSVLKQISPLIIKKQGTEEMRGFLIDSLKETVSILMGKYNFNIRHEQTWAYSNKTEGEAPRVGGMILQLSEDEFLIAGSGVIVTFSDTDESGNFVGIGRMDEVEYKDDNFIYGRRMNGDQSHQGRHMHIPGHKFSMQKVVLYKYR